MESILGMVTSYFRVDGLMPHGYCLIWNPLLLWSHVSADLIIFVAYMMIPMAIFYFSKKRPELKFKNIYALFYSFIFLCGLTHLISMIVLWRPMYGVEAIFKIMTAIVSMTTAIMVWKLVPVALEIPTPKQLKQKNKQLKDKNKEVNRLATDLNEQLVAMDDITDGWWDLDLVTYEEYISPKFKNMLGYNDNEIDASNGGWRRLTHPDDLTSLNTNLDTHIKTDTKEPLKQLMRYTHKDGSIVYGIFRGKAIKDSSGQYVRILGTHADITQQELNAKNLTSSNEELDQFAYIASHDLREPLRGMQSYSKLLLDEHSTDLDDDGRRYLERIDALGGRLEKYLDGLLSYSRIGRENDSYRVIGITTLIKNAIATHLNPSSLDETDIIYEDDLPSICCSEVQMLQIIGNLLSNSVKYKSDTPLEIQVTHEKIGDKKHLFRVIDNGIGIPKKHTEVIFNLFKRLHGRDEFQGGTGIGLTIAKKAAAKHGGSIWVEESAPGLGTTMAFIITEKTENESK